MSNGNDTIYYAYDGSLNGDWVFRYALRIAKNRKDTQLMVIHVLDEKIQGKRLSDKLSFLQAEGKQAKVKVEVSVVPKNKGGISQTLQATIAQTAPEDTAYLLICGARGRGKRRGYLRATVSEEILAIKNSPAHIMVVRVVQPGLLGQATDILLPISEKPVSLERTLFFLEYLQAPLQSLHILHVLRKTSMSNWQSDHNLLAQRTDAKHYARDLAQVIEKFIDNNKVKIDWRSVSAMNPLREILVQASHLRAQAILMGAPAISRHSGLWRKLPFKRKAWYELEEFLRQTTCDVIFYQERS